MRASGEGTSPGPALARNERIVVTDCRTIQRA